MNKPLIFLSHAGEDAQPARELAHHLEQVGLEVWLDVERLKPGDRWMEEIEKGLDQAVAFAVYVGPSGVRRWVDQEVRVALDRSTKENAFRLIPVLGPGADPDALPVFLKQYQWLDLREGFSEASRMKNLLKAVAGQPAEAVCLLPPDKPPFRGLLAFDVNDALLFYGRDREIVELVGKLRVNNFLAVVGDSGSGKSSLVKAGLIPALHRGRFYDNQAWVESWRIAILRPGDDPFRELAEALPDLKPGMAATERASFVANIRQQLSERGDGLRNGITALVPRGSHTLVVVDQFEELFTSTRQIDDRRRFVNCLFDAVGSQTERPVHVLITLRADFYSQCWQHDQLRKRLAVNQYNVGCVSAEQLQEVIEKPLALAGARAELGLVDVLLKDVGDEPGNLPLLEHALLQLWERREGKTITHTAYKEIGRLSGSLKNYADRVYDDLKDKQRQELARKILVHLTQLGEGSEDSRRRAKKAELLGFGPTAEATESVLKALTDARLITTSGKISSEADGKDDEVEVSHEALIREWPKLQAWLNENRDALRIERRLLDAARDWDTAKLKRDPGLLWAGTRLREAEDWSKKQANLAEKAKQFLEASRKARSVHRFQKLATVAAIAILVLGTATYGVIQWRRVQSERREAIVMDAVTGLMWTKSATGYDMDWHQANAYCESLQLGGYSGWRLPTFEQVKTLHDPTAEGPYRIRKPFHLTGFWVWTSTNNEGPPFTWGIDFYTGWRPSSNRHAHMEGSSGGRVLCVRGPGE